MVGQVAWNLTMGFHFMITVVYCSDDDDEEEDKSPNAEDIITMIALFSLFFFCPLGCWAFSKWYRKRLKALRHQKSQESTSLPSGSLDPPMDDQSSTSGITYSERLSLAESPKKPNFHKEIVTTSVNQV